jgi:hypothetical protein
MFLIHNREMPFWDGFLNRSDIERIRENISKTIDDEIKEDKCQVFPPKDLWYRIFESLTLDEVTIILYRFSYIRIDINIVSHTFE